MATAAIRSGDVRSRMRLAYVINSVEGGGAASPVPAIVGVLRRAGVAVRVFALTRRDARALPAMIAAGIDVAVRPGGETDHVAAWRWLDREVAAWGATHLWTSLTRATLLGQLVGLRRRLPVASWQHAAYLKPANLQLLRAMRRLSGLWIGDSASITRLTGARLGIAAARLATWPIFRADPQAPQAAAWRPGETIRIGSLGRLHPVKGYDVLIDAIARLPPGLPRFAIEIAGDGAERALLIARAGDAPVRFVGYAERPADWLAGCHLYVQPSRSEGLCVAAHEAMAAGLPVIASAVGALPDGIVEGETGRLVPPGDPEALALALATLLGTPASLASMGAAARARALDLFGPERFEAAGRAVLDRLRGS